MDQLKVVSLFYAKNISEINFSSMDSMQEVHEFIFISTLHSKAVSYINCIFN